LNKKIYNKINKMEKNKEEIDKEYKNLLSICGSVCELLNKNILIINSPSLKYKIEYSKRYKRMIIDDTYVEDVNSLKLYVVNYSNYIKEIICAILIRHEKDFEIKIEEL